jgi:preprotein translocase subunit SecA
MARLGMEGVWPSNRRWSGRRIESAQKNVEGHNFTIRKHLIEYDDVMNKQRETIYVSAASCSNNRIIVKSWTISEDLLDLALDQFLSLQTSPSEWDLRGFKVQMLHQFGFDIDAEGIELERLERPQIREVILERLKQKYADKESLVGAEAMRYYERIIWLNIVDAQWKDHLLALDHLKEGIGLRGYGQKDPLVEYKKESFSLFEAMLDRIDSETVRALYCCR